MRAILLCFNHGIENDKEEGMALAIKTREIEYTAADGSKLIGYFAAPETSEAVAGVIVAPEWWGRNEYTEQRARELAEHGFAALAIDMYGDKKVTTTATQANEWMKQTFEDADTIVTRASAAVYSISRVLIAKAMSYS